MTKGEIKMENKKDNKEKRITVRLTQDWYEELRLYAELEERPMSTIARMAIIEYLTNHTEE